MQKIVTEQHGTLSGAGFFDFGQAAYGTLEVELDGTFHEHIELVIGEVAADGKIIHESGWRTFITDRIRLRNGHHCYRFRIPKFLQAYGFRHSPPTPPECGGEIAPFRYAEINHYYGKAVVRRTAWYDDWNDDAADFECSDPALNRIWEFCKYSIRATHVFGVYIDGERERKPYEGDTYINQLGHFCCDANYRTARATIDYFGCHPTYPTEWQLLTPVLARDYWLYSGDRTAVTRWLDWLPDRLLTRFADSSGLLRAHGKITDIVDWPQCDRDGYVFGKINFVPNAYYHEALRAMYELTGDIGYMNTAAQVRAELRRQLWPGKLPFDSVGSTHTALHTALFALRFGIANRDEIPALTEFIRSRGMACSVYGAQFLLECCAQNGLEDHFHELLSSTGSRGWLAMLAQGSTIAMESWGEYDKPFQDWTHAWGAAPANLIPRWLVGIRPTRPGFAEYILDPHPGKLKFFRYRQPTPDGPIDVFFENGRCRAERH